MEYALLTEKMIKLTKALFLILLTLSVSGVVNAKPTSGVQNLAAGVHQGDIVINALLRLGKTESSYDGVSGSPVVPNSPAQRLADKVQNLPASQRPNTVAVIKHKDGTVTVGRNQGGVQNPAVQDAINRAPNNCFGGQCAETNAISRALNKGRSLDGIGHRGWHRGSDQQKRC